MPRRDEEVCAAVLDGMEWGGSWAAGLAGKINFHICDFTYVMLIQIGLERETFAHWARV